MTDESSVTPEQTGSQENLNKMVPVKKVEVPEQTKERISQEVKPILKFLKDSVVKDGEMKGLLPYVEKDGSTKYRSEDLGYALQLAVNGNDQELFRSLFEGVQKLKITEDGPGKGLFKASIEADGNPTPNAGTAWADGDQDIALALIEAGLKWGDQAALKEGKDAAESFINSSHIARVGDKLGLTATLAGDQQYRSGNRIRAINLSMYNYKLYEQMQKLDPTEKRWQKLHQSGLDLTEEVLQNYKLPADMLYSIDGANLSNTADTYDHLNPDHPDFNPSLSDSVPEITRNYVRSKQKVDFRPVWSNDALRIPYRLTDSADGRAHELSQQILQRLEETGGIRKRVYADTGESADASSEKPGYVVAPLAKTIMEKIGDPDAAINEIVNNTGEWEKSRVYNQSWIGLGLTQLAA